MPSPFQFSVKKESFYIRLIQIEGTHFFNTLQEKMRWGVDIRNLPHQSLIAQIMNHTHTTNQRFTGLCFAGEDYFCLFLHPNYRHKNKN